MKTEILSGLQIVGISTTVENKLEEPIIEKDKEIVINTNNEN